MTDPIIEKYYAIKPLKYKLLDFFNLKRIYVSSSFVRFDLSIKLLSSLDPLSDALSLDFEGVRDLRIGSLDQIGVNHLMVDIRSIEDSQLENLNYKVFENEENAFSFSCNQFQATVISCALN